MLRPKSNFGCLEVVIFHVFGPSEFSKFDFRCNAEALRRFVYRRLSAFEFRVSISECVFGGSRGWFFGFLFGPRSVAFRRYRKVTRCFIYKHLRAFGVSKLIFFEYLKSVNFGPEKSLKPYVYNGFSDFRCLLKT